MKQPPPAYHSEPFDFAQDKLREESLSQCARLFGLKERSLRVTRNCRLLRAIILAMTDINRD
jgi:hypothetical protein